jgi:tape measure domain-containing protein
MAAAQNQVAIDLLARNMATRELDAAAKTLQGLGNTVQGTSLMARSASQIWAGAMMHIGESVKNFLFKGIQIAGDSIIGFNSRVEQAMIGFTTMLGSAAKAQGFMEELQQFAASTPFEFDGLRQSANLIMAMGFEAKEVIPLLTAAGDAVAALGLGTEAVQRVVYALGQMRAAGRVTGQDMMQLSAMGIPAWKMLADSIGKSVMETKKLAEQGAIDAETAIAAITTAIEEGNMGGMMAAQARTFNGAVSTIKDTIQIVVSQAFKPLFDTVSQTTVGIADFLGSEGFLEWADEVREAISGAIAQVMSLVDVLIPIVQGILPVLADVLGDVLGAIGLIASAGAAAFGGILMVLGPILPLLTGMIVPLATFLTTFRALGMAVSLYGTVMAAATTATAGAAIGVRAFGAAFITAMGPMGLALTAGAALITLFTQFVDIGAEINDLAMDFGSMGVAVDGLMEKTGEGRDAIKDALSDMIAEYGYTFEEAADIMYRFGDDAEDAAGDIASIMDDLGVSAGTAGDLLKRWGDDWESSARTVAEATAATGISWETMQSQMSETYGFLSAADQMQMMYDAAARGPEAWKALMDGYQGVDEATEQLATEFGLLRERIDEAGLGIVDSVQKTADGIVVTLTDGTVLTGKTADELFGQITQAAEDARAASIQKMADMLTGMAGMFESNTEVRAAFNDLLERLDDPYTEAERRADIFGRRMLRTIAEAVASDDPGAVAETTAFVNRMLGEIELMDEGALAAGTAVPGAMRAGMDAQMASLITYLRTENGIIISELSLDEAKQMGLDGIWLYAQGMRLNAFRAHAEATSVAGQVKAALEFDASAGGKSIITTWASGFQAAWNVESYKLEGIVGHAANILGRSLPREGPLTHPWTGGYSIIAGWLEGMTNAGDDLIVARVGGLAQRVADEFGNLTASATAGLTFSGAGGPSGGYGYGYEAWGGGGMSPLGGESVGGTTGIVEYHDKAMVSTASPAEKEDAGRIIADVVTDELRRRGAIA